LKTKENIKKSIKKSENPGKSSKPLLQSRAHGNGNKPLLLLLFCRARDSPLLVGPHVAHVALPLCLSPPLFVALVLLFHNSTHTHKDKRKKEKIRQKEE